MLGRYRGGEMPEPPRVAWGAGPRNESANGIRALRALCFLYSLVLAAGRYVSYIAWSWRGCVPRTGPWQLLCALSSGPSGLRCASSLPVPLLARPCAVSVRDALVTSPCRPARCPPALPPASGGFSRSPKCCSHFCSCSALFWRTCGTFPRAPFTTCGGGSGCFSRTWNNGRNKVCG